MVCLCLNLGLPIQPLSLLCRLLSLCFLGSAFPRSFLYGALSRLFLCLTSSCLLSSAPLCRFFYWTLLSFFLCLMPSCLLISTLPLFFRLTLFSRFLSSAPRLFRFPRLREALEETLR